MSAAAPSLFSKRNVYRGNRVEHKILRSLYDVTILDIEVGRRHESKEDTAQKGNGEAEALTIEVLLAPKYCKAKNKENNNASYQKKENPERVGKGHRIMRPLLLL